MSEKIERIKYTSEEYNDKKLKFFDENSQRIYFNFSQEIMLRNDYWREDLNRRRRNHLISQGNILDNRTKQVMEANKIKPVEPNIVSTLINNLTDTVYRGHYTGRIKTLFHDQNSIAAADLDLLIKMLKRDIDFEKWMRELAKMGISESFYPFLMIQIEDEDVGRGRISLRMYNCDAVLPGMKIYATGTDVDDIILIDWCDREQLYLNYADKKKEIDEWNLMYGKEQDFVKIMTKRAVLFDREGFQQMFDNLKTAPQGSPLRNRDFEVIYTWLRKVVADVKCFVDFKSGNEIILDDTWDKERAQDFLSENTNYEMVTRKRNVIWETAMTTSGLILRNRLYPIQIPTTARDVMLPGVCYVPNIIHGKTEGLIDVIRADLVNLCVTASEELNQVFSSGGMTTYVEEGAVSEPDVLRDELPNRWGVVTLTPGGINKIVDRPRQFNDTFSRHYENLYARIKEYSGMNDEMQGRMSSGQSNYRTRMAILQSMSSHSPYIRNMTECDLKLTNALMYLFCMTTTDEEVFSVTNSGGKEMEISTNQVEIQKTAQPQEEEDKGVKRGWQIIRTINDLRKGKFKYMITEQSSSELTDEAEQEAYDAFMASTGNVLVSMMQNNPKSAAIIMKSMSNSLIRATGEELEAGMAAEGSQDINSDAQSQNAPPGLAGELQGGNVEAAVEGDAGLAENADVSDESQDVYKEQVSSMMQM